MLQATEVETDAREGRLMYALPLSKFGDFIGVLKDAPCFSEDPVAIQRKVSDEWDDKE